MIGAAQVASPSAAAEVEGVDVTFSDAGGVSSFLAVRPPCRLFSASRQTIETKSSAAQVGDSGNARATTIVAEGDINGGVRARPPRPFARPGGPCEATPLRRAGCRRQR